MHLSSALSSLPINLSPLTILNLLRRILYQISFWLPSLIVVSLIRCLIFAVYRQTHDVVFQAPKTICSSTSPSFEFVSGANFSLPMLDGYPQAVGFRGLSVHTLPTTCKDAKFSCRIFIHNSFIYIFARDSSIFAFTHCCFLLPSLSLSPSPALRYFHTAFHCCCQHDLYSFVVCREEYSTMFVSMQSR